MDNNASLPLAKELLEERIGYKFNNAELLTEALTHSSYINEHKGSDLNCNERLEFLGDSVLSIVVSRYLFFQYSSRQEGDLTKIRAAVVCEKALAKYAKEICLGDYLYLGHGEDKNNGRTRASITSDAFEALLGAMYIDTDYDAERVSLFLMPFVKKEIDYIRKGEAFADYKTALQQIIQQANGERLVYTVVGESGPDHEKTFTVEARLNSNVIGVGSGSSKRAAEQAAAREALRLFGADETLEA
ncbi:MAG: ribonuclease III [Clostridia bacterium]|nr:ribonuclease III [Clostridia bacterium]